MSLLFKVILIGDSGVGKSAVADRFCGNVFHAEAAPTLGIDFKYGTATTIEVPPRTVQFQVWDTAGQQTFLTLTTSFYRNSHAVVLCFDLTSRLSFSNLDNWLERVRRYQSNDATPLILVGCKADIAVEASEGLLLGVAAAPKSYRQVQQSEADTWARENGCVCFVETSAKDNVNIQYIFQILGTRLCEKIGTPTLIPNVKPVVPAPERHSQPPPKESCAC